MGEPDPIKLAMECVLTRLSVAVDMEALEEDPDRLARDIVREVVKSYLAFDADGARLRPDLATLARACEVAHAIESGEMTAGTRTVTEALGAMFEEAFDAAPSQPAGFQTTDPAAERVVHIADSGIEHLHERLDTLRELIIAQGDRITRQGTWLARADKSLREAHGERERIGQLIAEARKATADSESQTIQVLEGLASALGTFNARLDAPPPGPPTPTMVQAEAVVRALNVLKKLVGMADNPNASEAMRLVEDTVLNRVRR